MWVVKLPDAGATHRLGEVLGTVMRDAVAVGLVGDLGAGKTTLAQGVAEGLGIEGPVLSPTFALMVEYPGRLPLLHVDAYRLGPGEAEGIGLEEHLEDWPGAALVEWSDRVPAAMPLDGLLVELRHGAGRTAHVTALGPEGHGLLVRWQRAWGTP